MNYFIHLVLSTVFASVGMVVQTSQIAKSPRIIQVREPVGRSKLESTAFSQEDEKKNFDVRQPVQVQHSDYKRKDRNCCRASDTDLCFWSVFCCTPSCTQCTECLQACCSSCCEAVDEVVADEEM